MSRFRMRAIIAGVTIITCLLHVSNASAARRDIGRQGASVAKEIQISIENGASDIEQRVAKDTGLHEKASNWVPVSDDDDPSPYKASSPQAEGDNYAKPILPQTSPSTLDQLYSLGQQQDAPVNYSRPRRRRKQRKYLPEKSKKGASYDKWSNKHNGLYGPSTGSSPVLQEQQQIEQQDQTRPVSPFKSSKSNPFILKLAESVAPPDAFALLPAASVLGDNRQQPYGDAELSKLIKSFSGSSDTVPQQSQPATADSDLVEVPYYSVFPKPKRARSSQKRPPSSDTRRYVASKQLEADDQQQPQYETQQATIRQRPKIVRYQQQKQAQPNAQDNDDEGYQQQQRYVHQLTTTRRPKVSQYEKQKITKPDDEEEKEEIVYVDAHPASPTKTVVEYEGDLAPSKAAQPDNNEQQYVVEAQEDAAAPPVTSQKNRQPGRQYVKYLVRTSKPAPPADTDGYSEKQPPENNSDEYQTIVAESSPNVADDSVKYTISPPASEQNTEPVLQQPTHSANDEAPQQQQLSSEADEPAVTVENQQQPILNSQYKEAHNSYQPPQPLLYPQQQYVRRTARPVLAGLRLRLPKQRQPSKISSYKDDAISLANALARYPSAQPPPKHPSEKELRRQRLQSDSASRYGL